MLAPVLSVTVSASGITGGMNIGALYLGRRCGFSDPPASRARATPELPRMNRPTPPVARALKKCLLLFIQTSSSGRTLFVTALGEGALTGLDSPYLLAVRGS